MSSIKLLLTLLLSVALLIYAFHGIDLSTFWTSLTAVDAGVVAILLVLPLLSIVLRGWRWQILLGSLKPLSFQTAFSYSSIGFMANNILPAHAGELVKALLLARRHDMPVLAVLATVVVERVLDALTLTLLLGGLLTLMPLPAMLRSAGVGIGTFGVVIIALVILLSRDNSPVRDGLRRLIRRLPQRARAAVLPRFDTFLLGLGALRGGRRVAGMALLSVLVWGVLIWNAYAAMAGFPFAGPLPDHLWLASAVVILTVSFAVALPAAPGFVGVTQAAFWVALQLFDVRQSDAIGASVLYNLTQYVAVTGLGIAFLFREGLGMRHLVAASHTEPPAPRGGAAEAGPTDT